MLVAEVAEFEVFGEMACSHVFGVSCIRCDTGDCLACYAGSFARFYSHELGGSHREKSLSTVDPPPDAHKVVACCQEERNRNLRGLRSQRKGQN